MKKIQIKGKRNIDSIKGVKNAKRKIVEKIENKELFKEKSQIEWLNRLYLKDSYKEMKFGKDETERKIKSYRQQDISKKRLDETFITYEECLEKLVISKLRCYYCRKECLFLYEKVREPMQWTLDRIDNNKCHSKDNVVICCLMCNLKKGTKNDKKFKFTKQMRIIKQF